MFQSSVSAVNTRQNFNDNLINFDKLCDDICHQVRKEYLLEPVNLLVRTDFEQLDKKAKIRLKDYIKRTFDKNYEKELSNHIQKKCQGFSQKLKSLQEAARRRNKPDGDKEENEEGELDFKFEVDQSQKKAIML